MEKPKNKEILGVRIDKSVKKRLERAAGKEDRTISYLVVRFIEDGLKRLEQGAA